MPSVNIYVSDKVYWRVCRYANLWEKPIGKTAQLILEKGLEYLEGEEKRLKKSANTALCMKHT